MKKFKVYNTINGIEGYCGRYAANSEIGACVAHIRKCGGVQTARLETIPAGYVVQEITP